MGLSWVGLEALCPAGETAPTSPLCFCSLCRPHAEGLRAGGQRGGQECGLFGGPLGHPCTPGPGRLGGLGQVRGQEKASSIWWCLLLSLPLKPSGLELAWVFFARKEVESGSQFAGRILACYTPPPNT